MLLLSLTIISSYGAYLAYTILNADLQSHLVPAAVTRGSISSKRWSTGLTWTRWLDLWGWALRRQTRIGAIGLLAAMAGPLPAGFLAYHVYLIWAGMTTNESSKWADLGEDVADGLVWKVRRVDVVDREEREREEKRTEWPVAGQWVVVVTPDGEMLGQDKSGQAGAGYAAVGRGQNGHASGAEVLAVGYEDPTWEKVTSLAEVENVYDLGFWGNLRDSFFNRD
jgi:palmitoyltransferase ZDHHC4